MRTLIAPLLALFIGAPLAWAESEQATSVEKQLEAKQIETEQRIENNSTEQQIDRLFDEIFQELDRESAQLSEEEKQEIREIREKLEVTKSALKELNNADFPFDWNSGETSFMGMLTGLVAVILIFGGPTILVAIVLYSSFRKRRLTHDTINNCVASGKDIPSEILQGLQKQENPKSNLHKGLIMVSLGLGIMGFYLTAGDTEEMGLGLIPLFIGLAQLLVWKLENKKPDLSH